MSLGTRTHEGHVWTGYRRAETDRRITELADKNTKGRVVDNTVRVYYRTPCVCKRCSKRFLAPSANSRPSYCSDECRRMGNRVRKRDIERRYERDPERRRESDRRSRPWRYADLAPFLTKGSKREE